MVREDSVKKTPAHDKWVCLNCRWTAKIELVDVRASDRPSYRCPKCRSKMLWTGTAFRPPKRNDDEAWLVVEKLLATGLRFHTTSTRRRVPRTLRDLDVWLAEQDRPDVWLQERRARVRPSDVGPVVQCGDCHVVDGEQLLMWHQARWAEGTLRRRGDGGIVLKSPVVRLTHGGRSVTLTSGARLRLRRRRSM